MEELNPTIKQAIKRNFSKLDIQAPNFEEEVKSKINQLIEMQFKGIIKEWEKADNGKQSKDENEQINQMEIFDQIVEDLLTDFEQGIRENTKNKNVNQEEKENIIQKIKGDYTNRKISTILKNVDGNMSVRYDIFKRNQAKESIYMDILTEEMKDSLKAKFQSLDIQDEHFQEKIEEIINEALSINKIQVTEHVMKKSVDNALDEEKEGFAEFKDLMNEGILEDIEDITLKDSSKQRAIDGILNEEEEKNSLEKVISIELDEKETLIQRIIEEILKQLEDVIEEKKQEIQKKIEKNEDMLGKVQRRDKLRASRIKVNQLHQKTKNYKGTEGKKLNQNIEAIIGDFDKQIEALTLATTVNGKEKQVQELEQEKQQLVAEKKKLEDMLETVKEKYTKEQYKQTSKVLLTDEIQNKMNEIQYGMRPEIILEKAEEIRKIFLENRKKFTIEELRDIFKNVSIIDKEGSGKNLTASTLADIGAINDIRKLYIYETGQEKEKQDENEIEWCKKQFNKLSDHIKEISGETVSPLKTEAEYIEELKGLESEAERNTSSSKKGEGIQRVNQRMKGLQSVLQQVIGFVSTDGIKKTYHNVIEKLKSNPKLSRDELPDEIIEEKPLKKIQYVSKDLTSKTSQNKETGNRDTGEEQEL